MKHTKGPWHLLEQGKHLSGGDGDHIVTAYIQDIPVSICDIPIAQQCGLSNPTGKDLEYIVREKESIANGKLIAAAPDLLEACKYVVRYHKENDSGEGELFGLDFVTTCIAAMGKAEI